MIRREDFCMSELASRLLAVIQRGPIEFSELWAVVPYEDTFDDMQAALAELLDAGKIERMSDTFVFRVAEAA
jgi:hypothetical protein